MRRQVCPLSMFPRLCAISLYLFFSPFTGSMDVDGGASSSSTKKTKISTHGPRNSRREEWRVSKGMPARPKSRGMNRQGGIAAARNSGRSHRRR